MAESKKNKISFLRFCNQSRKSTLHRISLENPAIKYFIPKDDVKNLFK